ncbi:ATP-binding protein [Neptuniibacter sp. CAU 1671]|uniref:ATP-binding protein n=1 Tax=Neptuniibacter sp. CAU 1671 TaxID=3032593 RepID=UPI0023DA149A|nr:ATP-binding protein [Neptuniibacter sp. CAU 1671]MDF2182602.1 ATP-binding protein [Neptuniibacter sp. CAU 1671]
MTSEITSGWKSYRSLILLLLVLIFLAVIGKTAEISQQRGYEELQQRSATNLNRYLISLQQKLERYRDLPSLLSTHSLLVQTLLQPDDRGVAADASVYLEYVNHTVGSADVYLMAMDGTTLAASNWAEARSFVGSNYAFRPYFKDAVKGRAGQYFALGTVSKKRGYYFSYPVYANLQVIGVVVVKIDLNDIEADWSDPDQDLLVTDEDGVIFISTREEWKFKTLRPLNQPDLQRIIESLRYGDHTLTALDIVDRKPRPDGSELITLVEGDRISSPALDGVKAREYLVQTRRLEGSGLSVVALASTRPVAVRMVSATVTSGFVYVALVLLVLFLVTRHRIQRERLRFKQKETQALEANEQRVRAIIDSTQAGLITLDSQGRIESFNTMAERLFGYNQAEIVGEYFSKLLSQGDRPICWHYLTSDPAHRTQELTIEARAVRNDHSTFPVDLIIGEMVYGPIKRFLVTIHDITQRKQFEDALEHARELLEQRVEERTLDLTRANSQLRDEAEKHKSTQDQLIQTAKLAVLGQMSAGINHELNQPLTAIRTYADNARAFLALGKPETVNANLQEISGLTERMAKIIHPLKEFSRKSSGAPEPVCLKNVRDGAMSILYGKLSKVHAAVEWPGQLEQYFVMGDTVRLEQVFVNLIGNALQAMEDQDQPRIEITLQERTDEIEIALRDYGPGIPKAELSRVFEPFYTTKKAGQGLGLGLSISHRIMVNLGGQLSARNHPEGGAVFILILPKVTTQDRATG